MELDKGSQNWRVVIMAGEASGDLYGADLARHLRAQLRTVEIWGVGGARMREAGVRLVADSQSWGAIGIVQSLRKVTQVLRAFQRLKRTLQHLHPDLIVPIDFGAFNVPLCRWAKQRGYSVVYYIPPGSWRRERQGADLPKVADWILTPFAWSAEQLQAMGARAVRIVHPLLRLARPAETKEAFCERVGITPDRPIIALLPGSRHHEVSAHTPLFARLADEILEQVPEAQFVLSIAPNFTPDYIHQLWSEGSWQWVPTETRPVWDLLAHADCAVICSGTATLESALLNTPMLIVYRGSPLMHLEYRLRRRQLALQMIGLPNLILGEKVVPEFIQQEATPAHLKPYVLELLRKGDLHHAQISAFQRIRHMLGEGEDLWEAPAWIAHYLTASTPPPVG